MTVGREVGNHRALVHPATALLASLVLTLSACTPSGPTARSEEVLGHRGLVRVLTEEERVIEAIDQEMRTTFGALTEEERSHYCNLFASETVSYADAFEDAVREEGPSEYAGYGTYAESRILDRCFGGGYVAPAAPTKSAGIKEAAPRTSTKSACAIKGNISFDTGERIYHLPGQTYYDDTVINEDAGERWFCTEREALDAGWRKSKL